MEFDDSHAFGLFLEVYGTLPRAGPGGDAHTIRALRLVPGPTPRAVVDLGCGPGAQTIALASALPGAQIIAVDVLPAMVDETRRRLVELGLTARVLTVEADMSAPPVAAASQDLIWCEGAIYNLGVTEALTCWRPLLRAGGSVAFTEPVWLVDSPPQPIRDWWLAEYPAITDRAGVGARVEAAGYREVASFVLPASAWWDEYYEPMQGRIAGLKARRAHDPVAAEIVAAAEAEIDHFRRFSEYYTYAFFIVRPCG